ncbi:MAG TPA: hypothetical protein VGM64_18015 [Lacunisphaera sp.]|jgi:hypothetical protein
MFSPVTLFAMTAAKREPGLDLLRSIAIGWVLLFPAQTQGLRHNDSSTESRAHQREVGRGVGPLIVPPFARLIRASPRGDIERKPGAVPTSGFRDFPDDQWIVENCAFNKSKNYGMLVLAD